ncbi:MAG TPA: aconitase/3-isopropylmalate dehydratase large subunit family protein [Acidobacteriota bacterium]|nr:aconitase/3-isopropylmalate dehydratase large subunit family protein [Acidobacteriota bacterium]
MKRRRKIPTKAELLQLQKLYKTDERIGERLGGVPAYLVAYWRRKKNIPKYSLPKFSEQEIRNLWERYGDDEKAGLELGISKAAFYNWRRRYGFREKPAFLKLEQLELNFPGSRLNVHAASLYGKRTMAQKILARAAGRENVAAGEWLDVEPDIAVLHGSSVGALKAFRSRGVDYVWNPNKIVITLGFGQSDGHRDRAVDHRAVREFVKRQGIRNFYDLQDGSSHQVVVEKGHILPGLLALGTGGQALSYGCLGAFAADIDDAAMAGLWATGGHAMQVPATVKIIVGGRRYRGVYAKDIVLSIIGRLGSAGAQEKAIEYAGSVVSQMTISERFTLANLSVEMAAVAALCPYDATTRRYLAGRAAGRSTPVIPDKDAEYEEMYQINVDQLLPQVAGPGGAARVRPAAELEGLAVHQVILGSCASGRFDELRAAADILKGKQVHADCRMIVIPGSRSVYLEALKKGLIRVLAEAGAVVMSSSNCPCQGMPHALLAPRERCLATTNSHLLGHLGSNEAELYLCSAATLAASALNAEITDPTRYMK